MNNKVEELVEWVARQLPTGASPLASKNWDEIGAVSKEIWQRKARLILSHPDLALIDRRNYNAFNKHEVPKGAELAMIVPLAEALKEIRDEVER